MESFGTRFLKNWLRWYLWDLFLGIGFHGGQFIALILHNAAETGLIIFITGVIGYAVFGVLIGAIIALIAAALPMVKIFPTTIPMGMLRVAVIGLVIGLWTIYANPTKYTGTAQTGSVQDTASSQAKYTDSLTYPPQGCARDDARKFVGMYLANPEYGKSAKSSADWKALRGNGYNWFMWAVNCESGASQPSAPKGELEDWFLVEAAGNFIMAAGDVGLNNGKREGDQGSAVDSIKEALKDATDPQTVKNGRALLAQASASTSSDATAAPAATEVAASTQAPAAAGDSPSNEQNAACFDNYSLGKYQDAINGCKALTLVYLPRLTQMKSANDEHVVLDDAYPMLKITYTMTLAYDKLGDPENGRQMALHSIGWGLLVYGATTDLNKSNPNPQYTSQQNEALNDMQALDKIYPGVLEQERKAFAESNKS